MVRQTTIVRSISNFVACWISLSAIAYGQAMGCKTTEFTAVLKGDEGFSKNVATSLRLRLLPLRQQWGWAVEVSPTNDLSKDWTFPVNMPLRTGERQLLGTGYGDTVRDKFQWEHSIRFLLNQRDFDKYSHMANETLKSSDPDAAGQYLSVITKVTTGIVEIKALEASTSENGEAVESAQLRFRVIVPVSFAVGSDLRWKPAICPAND